MKNLTRKQKNVLTGIIGILTASFIFAITLHSVDKYIMNTQAESIDIDMETLGDYNSQITELISYKNMDKMYLMDTKKKKNDIYLTYSDGYSGHVFVFRDDTLYQFGSDIQGDLIHIDEVLSTSPEE